jgi:hypothetical protein
MQPKPSADTVNPCVPSFLFFINQVVLVCSNQFVESLTPNPNLTIKNATSVHIWNLPKPALWKNEQVRAGSNGSG